MFLVAGVVAGLWLQGVSITGLFSNAVTFVKSQLQPATTFIQHNAPFIGVGFTALTTAGALLIRRLTKAKDAIAAQAEDWRNEAFQTNEVARQILEKKEEAEQKLNTVRDQLTGEIGELKAELTRKDDRIAELKEDLAEAVALSHFDEDSIVEKLRKTE